MGALQTQRLPAAQGRGYGVTAQQYRPDDTGALANGEPVEGSGQGPHFCCANCGSARRAASGNGIRTPAVPRQCVAGVAVATQNAPPRCTADGMPSQGGSQRATRRIGCVLMAERRVAGLVFILNGWVCVDKPAGLDYYGPALWFLLRRATRVRLAAYGHPAVRLYVMAGMSMVVEEGAGLFFFRLFRCGGVGACTVWDQLERNVQREARPGERGADERTSVFAWL